VTYLPFKLKRYVQKIPLTEKSTKGWLFAVGRNFVAISAVKSQKFTLKYTDDSSQDFVVKHDAVIIAHVLVQNTFVTMSQDRVLKVTDVVAKTTISLKCEEVKSDNKDDNDDNDDDDDDNDDDDDDDDNDDEDGDDVKNKNNQSSKKKRDPEEEEEGLNAAEIVLGYKTWWLAVATKNKIFSWKGIKGFRDFPEKPKVTKFGPFDRLQKGAVQIYGDNVLVVGTNQFSVINLKQNKVLFSKNSPQMSWLKVKLVDKVVVAVHLDNNDSVVTLYHIDGKLPKVEVDDRIPDEALKTNKETQEKAQKMKAEQEEQSKSENSEKSKKKSVADKKEKEKSENSEKSTSKKTNVKEKENEKKKKREYWKRDQ